MPRYVACPLVFVRPRSGVSHRCEDGTRDEDIDVELPGPRTVVLVRPDYGLCAGRARKR